MFKWSGVLLALMASPLYALSCSEPDVARIFKVVDEDPTPWVIVHGTLDFDREDLPEYDWDDPENTVPVTRVQAKFDGHSLTRQGFTARFRKPVTLEVECNEVWCAWDPPGEYMAFLRQDGDQYATASVACGPYLFWKPSKAQLRQARRCLRGGACKPR